jgi:hypothetical protein
MVSPASRTDLTEGVFSLSSGEAAENYLFIYLFINIFSCDSPSLEMLYYSQDL